MRTSEVMAVGNASDADVTTAAHVRTREVCMSHLLHQLKISYVFTTQDEHNASFIELSVVKERTCKDLDGLCSVPYIGTVGKVLHHRVAMPY